VFGRAETEAVIVEAGGAETPAPPGSKAALADLIWDRVLAWRSRTAQPGL
jgi:phosphopantothenoylcysteine decarboxylase / phosphopantothenate---cysteine ligase